MRQEIHAVAGTAGWAGRVRSSEAREPRISTSISTSPSTMALCGCWPGPVAWSRPSWRACRLTHRTRCSARRRHDAKRGQLVLVQGPGTKPRRPPAYAVALTSMSNGSSASPSSLRPDGDRALPRLSTADSCSTCLQALNLQAEFKDTMSYVRCGPDRRSRRARAPSRPGSKWASVRLAPIVSGWRLPNCRSARRTAARATSTAWCTLPSSTRQSGNRVPASGRPATTCRPRAGGPRWHR
jgi:hypothetical protein